MFKEVYIKNVSRCFALPFPVASLGLFANDTCEMMRHVPEGRIEFCIRLASDAKVASDCIAGVEYRTKFPHLILKMPGVPHDYAVPDKRSAIFFTYPAEMTATLRQAGLLPRTPCLAIGTDPVVNALLRELEQTIPHTQESGVADRIDIICLQLLELLVLLERVNTGGEEERVRRVASWLQLHFTEDINFDELAASSGMSRSTFFRHWKQAFATTPAQYLLELRMQEAKRLLQCTNCGISTIAVTLRYCDCACFCAAFKRFFALTPQQFRRSNKTILKLAHKIICAE